MAVYPERRSGRLTGKWIAEVTEHGERRRKRFNSKRDGERWADYIKLTGAAPPGTEEAPKLGPTLGEVVKEAKEHHPGWAQGRDPSLGHRIDYALDVLGRDTAVAAIGEAELNKLVASLRKRPGKQEGEKLGAGTINRYLSAISAALTYAKKQRYISALPTVPWQKEAGRRLQWLDQEGEEAILKVMHEHGKTDEALTLRVLTATGMRWGEFAGLTADMIGGGWVKLDKTKTDSPRDVPIDPALGEELKRMIGRNAVPTYYTFRTVLTRALESAGQNEGLTIHGLRHSTASRLVQADVNLAIVKDFLGHKAIATTLKYTHVTPSKLQEAAKKLSQHAGQMAEKAVSEPIKVQENQGDNSEIGLAPRQATIPPCK